MRNISTLINRVRLKAPNTFEADITVDGGTMYIGSGTINAAAALQIDSTTQGVLFPRMTTAQRDAITTPPEGLLVWNTDDSALNVYDTAWGLLSGGGGATTLDGLTDTTLTSPANLHALMHDGTDWKNRLLVEADISDLQSYALSSHTHTLDSLTDVDVSTITPAAGQVLTHDGTDWDNAISYGTGANNLLQLDGTGLVPTGNLPSGVGSQPGFKGAKVRQTSAQTFTTAVAAAVSFNVSDYDSNTFFSGGNPTRLTVSESGYYLVVGQMSWEFNSSSRRRSYFRINGTTNSSFEATGAAPTGGTTTRNTDVVYLNANDYVEFFAIQDSGGNLDSNIGAEYLQPSFQIIKIETAASGGGFSGMRENAPTYVLTLNNTYEKFNIGSGAAVYDTDNYFDSGTSTTDVIIPADGYYAVAFGSYCRALGGTNLKAFRIELNGTAISGEWVADPASNAYEGGTVYANTYAQAGDVINITGKGSIGDEFYAGKFAIHRLDIGASGALNDLTDVANTTPADRHVLVYDGVTDNRYENRLLVEADISDLQSYALSSHVHSLDDASDVDLTTTAPVNTDVLTYDGTNWVPLAPTGGASTLDGLTDVDVSTITPAAGQVLTHDGTDWDNAISYGTGANNLLQLDGTGLVPTGNLPAGVGSQPGFKGAEIYSTVTTSVTSGAGVQVGFNTTQYDSNSLADLANNKLIIQEAGYYLVSGYVRWEAGTGTGRRIAQIKVNGSLTIQDERFSHADNVSDLVANKPTNVLFLNANDEITLDAFQTGDASLDLRVSDVYSYPRLSAVKIETAASGGGFSGTSVYTTTGQSIPTGVNTILTFDAEEYDTDSYHDNATNNSRLTVTEAGYYLITGRINWTDNGTGVRELRLKKNGTNITSDQHNGVAGTETTSIISHVVELAANDYVELHAFQSSGGALSLYTGGDPNWYPRFTLTKLESLASQSYSTVATASTLTGNSKTLADTSSAAVNYTLPTGVVGEFVKVLDAENNAATNNIVISPQTGEKVLNVVDDTITIDTNGGGVELVYTTNRGWIIGGTV